MTTFYSRQRDRARPAYKKANADTFNFASPIYTVMHTKRVKTDATSFESRCSRTVMCYRFYRVEALPLVWTRFLRLANSSPKTARSPARRSRDGRETSGEISRVISAQCPGNGRSVAATMPPSVRQDGSQDNLRHATAVPQFAQRPTQHLASRSPESRRQLSTMTSKNYEHINHTNARS